MLGDLKEINRRLKNKKMDTLDIFSSIKSINMDESYELLQGDIKDIGHNVGLLQLYATSNGKINLKKINLFKNKPLKHKNLNLGKGLYNNNLYSPNKNRKRYSTIFYPENSISNLNNSEKIDTSNDNFIDLPKISKTAKTLLKSDPDIKNNFSMTKFETKNNYSTKANTTANIFTHTNCNSTSLDFLNNKNNTKSIYFTSTNQKSEPRTRYTNNNVISLKKTKNFPISNLKQKHHNKKPNSCDKFLNDDIIQSRNTINGEFPQIVSGIHSNNNYINRLLYNGKKQLNLVDWYMKARFKYSEYRFGVAEIQKYFMDIDSFGKPEQEEIEKRKTYFDFAEQAIDEINENKLKKEIEDTKPEYGINLKKKLPLNEEEKKKIIKKIIENKKLYLNKRSISDDKEHDKIKTLSKKLDEVSERQKIEKIKRDRVKKLILMCRNKAGLITNYRGSLFNRK